MGIDPFVRMTHDFQPSCGENWSICGNSLEVLGPFVGSARLWESAPFVVLTLFMSPTYLRKGWYKPLLVNKNSNEILNKFKSKGFKASKLSTYCILRYQFTLLKINILT